MRRRPVPWRRRRWRRGTCDGSYLTLSCSLLLKRVLATQRLITGNEVQQVRSPPLRCAPVSGRPAHSHRGCKRFHQGRNLAPRAEGSQRADQRIPACQRRTSNSVSSLPGPAIRDRDRRPARSCRSRSSRPTLLPDAAIADRRIDPTTGGRHCIRHPELPPSCARVSASTIRPHRMIRRISPWASAKSYQGNAALAAGATMVGIPARKRMPNRNARPARRAHRLLITYTIALPTELPRRAPTRRRAEAQSTGGM
jgi:hypothetical protein